MQNVKPFFIKVITPLHAGSGSDLGVVDLPIQRESHTGFPKIEASSLKGSIRSAFNSVSNIEDIFGSENGEKAGKLGFSDARILFFPVKSVRGVFAYVTCPMVLKRFEADRTTGSEASASPQKELWFPQTVDESKCIVLGDKNKIDNTNNVILEEYSFEATTISGEVKTSLPETIYNDIKDRIVIISDDNFTHFVKNSTEVITRIRLKNGVADKESGGLFTEEYLPAESVMYALAIGEVEKFTEAKITTLQIGGDTNLGKGIVELTIGVKVEDKK